MDQSKTALELLEELKIQYKTSQKECEELAITIRVIEDKLCYSDFPIRKEIPIMEFIQKSKLVSPKNITINGLRSDLI